MPLRFLLFLILLVPCFSAASADSYVYAVANHFATFSVDGTITTDTNIGVLGFNDITRFNLTLTSGSGMDILTPANADNTGLYGYGLTAMPDGLYFDFDTPDTLLFFQNTAAGTSLCYQTAGCVNGSPSGEYISLQNSQLSVAQSGVVQIATLLPMTVTPEPSSLLLLGTGLLGVAAATRRRVR